MLAEAPLLDRHQLAQVGVKSTSRAAMEAPDQPRWKGCCRLNSNEAVSDTDIDIGV